MPKQNELAGGSEAGLSAIRETVGSCSFVIGITGAIDMVCLFKWRVISGLGVKKKGVTSPGNSGIIFYGSESISPGLVTF